MVASLSLGSMELMDLGDNTPEQQRRLVSSDSLAPYVLPVCPRNPWIQSTGPVTQSGAVLAPPLIRVSYVWTAPDDDSEAIAVDECDASLDVQFQTLHLQW